MAIGYTVSLRITVNKGEPPTLVVMEETNFVDMGFSAMTRISADFYELIAKLQKEKK